MFNSELKKEKEHYKQAFHVAQNILWDVLRDKNHLTYVDFTNILETLHCQHNEGMRSVLIKALKGEK